MHNNPMYSGVPGTGYSAFIKNLPTFIGPNKKNVLWVTGLKILGRVGSHICLIIFFSGKKIQFYAF